MNYRISTTLLMITCITILLPKIGVSQGIVLSSSSVNIGEVFINESSRVENVFTNNSTTGVVLGGVKVNSGFSDIASVEYSSKSYPAMPGYNSGLEFEMTFLRTGDFEVPVVLEFGPESTEVILMVKAKVVLPPYEVIEGSLSWEDADHNSEKVLSCQLKANYGNSLEISNIESPFKVDFKHELVSDSVMKFSFNLDGNRLPSGSNDGRNSYVIESYVTITFSGGISKSLPIVVEVHDIVKCEPNSIQLAFGERKTQKKTNVRLEGRAPFEVLKVTSSSELITTTFEKSTNVLEIIVSEKVSKQPFSEKVIIHTNLTSQPTIEISLFGWTDITK